MHSKSSIPHWLRGSFGKSAARKSLKVCALESRWLRKNTHRTVSSMKNLQSSRWLRNDATTYQLPKLQMADRAVSITSGDEGVLSTPSIIIETNPAPMGTSQPEAIGSAQAQPRQNLSASTSTVPKAVMSTSHASSIQMPANSSNGSMQSSRSFVSPQIRTSFVRRGSLLSHNMSKPESVGGQSNEDSESTALLIHMCLVPKD